MHCDLIQAFSGACLLTGATARHFGVGNAADGHNAKRDDATAANNAPTPGSFDLPRVLNPNHQKNGTHALIHAFNKFNWPLTSVAAPLGVPANDKAGSPSLTASVASVPQPYGSEYLSPITVGTPPQTLHLDLDTGSADLWVFSSLQSAAQTAGHAGVFRPAASRTWRAVQGASWAIQYGDQSGASGLVGTDVVGVGSAAVAGQAVEVAQSASEAFLEDPASDGIVGLGFDAINSVRPQRVLGLFDNLRAQLAQPLFGVDLAEDGSGRFQFGYVNASRGALTVVAVDPSRGYWQFASPVFSVNGKQTRRQGLVSPIIADTGTSLLLQDPAVVAAYYSAVPSATFSDDYGGYVFPCGTALPTFGVAVGDPAGTGKLVQIPSRLMTYAPVDTDNNCFGSLQSNGGNGLQVLGDVFFRAAYVVFYGNSTNPQLGVVAKSDG